MVDRASRRAKFTHVVNRDLGSHLFWLIKKNLIWITNQSKYWKLQLKMGLVVFKKFFWSRFSFKTQFKIEFLLPFFGSRNDLKITLLGIFGIFGIAAIIFMCQSLEILNVFNNLTLKQIFEKWKHFLKTWSTVL